MKDVHSIAIVGGGLGGLATAVALSKYGFDVHVYERASSLREVGAGINISPQATKVLLDLGLGEGMASIGNVLKCQVRRSMETGTIVSEMDLGGIEDRLGAPYYVFHRADLLDIFAKAIAADRIHLGHRCIGLRELPESVAVVFENGKQIEADVVIGADGIHSEVRNHLYGKDSPEFTGQMAWRAILDGDAVPPELLGPHGFCGWVGQGSHLMTYYMRGRKLINIVTQTDTDEWLDEGWSIAGDPNVMRATFPNAAPSLQTLLDAVTDCSRWGLFSRKPTFKWGRGRIQLIGDAAHAMLPNAGQGAAQAFEDAYILARWLDAHRADPLLAFEKFKAVRYPRAHAVQRQSAANAKTLHSGKWDKAANAQAAKESQAQAALGLDWIYNYDAINDWDKVIEYPLSRG
ncbi:FAD-dependent monooxygenase [Sphingobium lactosutens]|uniref:FAD-dependent monooxygenase n=1 Tax=Sphingobium lactosutens TaxID=522773 RepID=UPI0015C032BC